MNNLLIDIDAISHDQLKALFELVFRTMEAQSRLSEQMYSTFLSRQPGDHTNLVKAWAMETNRIDALCMEHTAAILKHPSNFN